MLTHSELVSPTHLICPAYFLMFHHWNHFLQTLALRPEHWSGTRLLKLWPARLGEDDTFWFVFCMNEWMVITNLLFCVFSYSENNKTILFERGGNMHNSRKWCWITMWRVKVTLWYFLMDSVRDNWILDMILQDTDGGTRASYLGSPHHAHTSMNSHSF